jgi:hypothetical protein
MTNFETRKMIWRIISKIFVDNKDAAFIWLFSPEDMDEANRLPDGTAYGCIGISRIDDL